MAMDPWTQSQADARASLRRVAAAAAARGSRLRLDQRTAMRHCQLRTLWPE